MTESDIEALRQCALALHRQGSFADAERLYKQLLEVSPGDPTALLMYGVLAAQTSQPEKALSLFQAGVRADPRSFLAHNNLGIALSGQQKFQEALSSFDAALALHPRYADGYANRGFALIGLGRGDEALECYRRAAELSDNAPAYYRYGLVLRQSQKPAAALAAFERVLSAEPRFAAAHISRADLLLDMGRTAESLKGAETAVGIDATLVEGHVAKASALQRLGRIDEALAAYDTALSLNSNHLLAHTLRATALIEAGRFADALRSCDVAVALAPASIEAQTNRGIALRNLGRYADALEALGAALVLDPSNWSAHYNRAEVFAMLRRHSEALDDLDCCIRFQPLNAEAHNTKAMLLLLIGRLAEGWPEHEWRHRRGTSFPARAVAVAAPRWNGLASLKGKSLLVHWEQGIGDTFQFCRYALLAQQQGARVILEVRPALRRLLTSLGRDVRVVGDLSEATPADFSCALLDLPARFATTLQTIPAQVPYLRAEREAVAAWRARIGESGYRIGINWQGSAGPVDVGRSFPLALFEPLSRLPGVRLISLQMHFGSEQLAHLPQGMRVEVLGSDFNAGPDAFIDSAAALESLDLIITSDTAIAHLAGAMARPTWVLLKKTPDWRWLLDRNDSPWYPTQRLFRQQVSGDWQGVFTEVCEQLRIKLDQRQNGTDSVDLKARRG